VLVEKELRYIGTRGKFLLFIRQAHPAKSLSIPWWFVFSASSPFSTNEQEAQTPQSLFTLDSSKHYIQQS
jgi:hypothetical protein